MTSAPQQQTESTLTAAEVIGRFDDLPTLAPVAVEVLRLADDEDSSMGDITRTIERDPGLTMRLLRLANTATYNRGGEVANINRAAMLLGLRTLKLVTLGFSLVANLTSERFDATLLWRRSLASAVIARRLAADQELEIAGAAADDPAGVTADGGEKSGPADTPDDAFVAGLLANVGRLALAEEPEYGSAMASIGPWITPADEQRLFGFTSDDVTVGILRSWGLPSGLADAVGGRNREPGDEDQSRMAAILRVCDHAGDLLVSSEDEGRAAAFDALALAAAANLGMTVGDVELVLEELRPELSELAKMFDFEPVGRDSAIELVRSAHAQLVRMSMQLADGLVRAEDRAKSLSELNSQLEDAASIDCLTGLPNRRIFTLYMKNRIAGRRRHPRNTLFGLILMDVDRFKRVNDRYGHGVGDEVLAEFGERLLNGTRRGELAARIGGEEFALILPETSENELPGATERLRKLIDDVPFETSAGSLQITMSIGACCTDHLSEDSENQLFEVSDRSLYAAKAAGGNRVEIAPAILSQPQS